MPLCANLQELRTEKSDSSENILMKPVVAEHVSPRCRR
jgi:hypothetical protein